MIDFVPKAQGIPLAYRSLYESPLLSVTDHRCHAHEGGPAAEEQSENNSILLMRYGAFSKHLGKRRVTADVNQAVFLARTPSIASATRPTAVTAEPLSWLPRQYSMTLSANLTQR